jgi:hypothetical protein
MAQAGRKGGGTVGTVETVETVEIEPRRKSTGSCGLWVAGLEAIKSLRFLASLWCPLDPKPQALNPKP